MALMSRRSARGRPGPGGPGWSSTRAGPPPGPGPQGCRPQTRDPIGPRGGGRRDDLDEASTLEAGDDAEEGARADVVAAAGPQLTTEGGRDARSLAEDRQDLLCRPCETAEAVE